MPTALDDLVKELASSPRTVLVVAGAGVACATDDSPCASWRGLLQDGLNRCIERCPISTQPTLRFVQEMIDENTTINLVQAASRIEQALRQIHDGEYGKWLADSVGQLKLNNRRSIDALLSWGTRIATTNYDNLFEHASQLPAVIWSDTHLALQVLRGDYPGILHLHGHYSHPDSVVFGGNSYASICSDSRAQNLFRSIFTRDTIVFVGCGSGTNDPNFSVLFEWSKEVLANCQHTHYHLVRNIEREAVLEQYRGLRVTPIVYGDEFTELGPFLERICERIHEQSTARNQLSALMIRQDDYESNLRDLEAQIDLPPLEYVRRSFELAKSLWDTGGHRTAALHMKAAISKRGEQLTIPDHLEYLFSAIEYLLNDDLDFQAMELLNKSQAILNHSQARPTLQARFRQLLKNYLAARGDMNQLDAIIEASISTASPGERSRLEAERAEYHMLGGELARAENVIGRED